MSDLSEMLERIGLSEYQARFRDEGFETWEILMDITETDL